jgi:hypothetical protein
MFQNSKAAPLSGGADAVSGKTELLGSNAEECLRLARTTRDRAIRDELIRLAATYQERARALQAG